MTPKRTEVKNEKKIQDRIAAYTDVINASSLLWNLDQPKIERLKFSSLSPKTNADVHLILDLDLS